MTVQYQMRWERATKDWKRKDVKREMIGSEMKGSKIGQDKKAEEI